jgi:hypothetical protein
MTFEFSRHNGSDCNRKDVMMALTLFFSLPPTAWLLCIRKAVQSRNPLAIAFFITETRKLSVNQVNLHVYCAFGKSLPMCRVTM